MSSLLKIDCADKTNHHADKLNPGVMPAFPSNIIAAGRKNSGKGSTIKQLLMSAVPAFDSIYARSTGVCSRIVTPRSFGTC